MNGQQILEALARMLSGGIIFIGTAACIFGVVQIGLAIREGVTGVGGQLSHGIAAMVGGAIVTMAGMWAASSLNSSFLGG